MGNKEVPLTVTYDITTTVGKIRLIISDKDITNYIFTDEELTYFYTAEGSVNLAAAAALEAWAASYGANADSEKIGDYSYTQKIIDNMMKLAKSLRDAEAFSPLSDWAEMDLADAEEDTE